MRKIKDKDPVIALAVADTHLHHTPPLARSGEPDWFTAMARPINELDRLASELSVPILCAGDIFHHWKATPELINFALDCLPYMIAVPGQHDLPWHSYADIDKSAYATLVKAGRIANIRPGQPYLVESHGYALWIHGFPWGFPVTDPEKSPGGKRINIALHHAYRCLTSATAFIGAPEDAKVRSGEYKGFTTVIIGDNHIPFDIGGAGAYVFNCGGFMRRNADQVSHEPRIGLIHASGKVETHLLDCRLDVLTAVSDSSTAASEEQIHRIDGLIAELQELQGSSLDYPEAMRRAMKEDGLSPAARIVLAKALEGHGVHK